jgi:hypothetical protein
MSLWRAPDNFLSTQKTQILIVTSKNISPVVSFLQSVDKEILLARCNQHLP